jgi:seryl-tRNA synthetase
MGFTQSKKYDLEVWSPGQKRWLEVSSCSNFESFQARRMQLRYKNKDGQIEILHTLNGSGLALPRIVASILETYQEPSGKVNVPTVLQPYMRAKQL